MPRPKHSILLSMILLCSCTTLPVYVQGPGTPEAERHIQGIEDVWAVRVERVDDPSCAVVLHPTDGYKAVDCAGRDAIGCANGLDIWCPSGSDGLQVCAHEVGHVAGLEHTDAERNIMRPSASERNTHKTPHQQATVRRLTTALQVCRRGAP